MEMNNLKALDWEGIKSRITKGKYGDNLKEEDKETIIEAYKLDLINDVEKNKDKLSTYFGIKRRGNVEKMNKINVLRDEAQTFGADRLGDKSLLHRWIFERKENEVAELYKEQVNKEYEKKTDKGNAMIVQDILDELEIKWYSIPCGQTRTLETNHRSEVLAYAYIKDFKLGYFVVKTKRKVMGMKISCDGEQVKISPMKIKNAMEGIKRIVKAKNKSECFDDKSIKKAIQLEEQKEVEAEI